MPSHQRNQVALCKSQVVLKSALRDSEVRHLSLLADKIDGKWRTGALMLQRLPAEGVSEITADLDEQTVELVTNALL